MLKVAFLYKEKLQEQYKKTIYQDFFKYCNSSQWWNNELTPANDSWKAIEFVSVNNKDECLGYFKAEIERPENHISGLCIMNFSSKGNPCFSKDMFHFIRNLFTEYGFYKIVFSVVVGNPIEKMYDKYVKKYGGRIVGVYKKHIMLHNGKLYDKKFYEILKEEFESTNIRLNAE